MRALLIYPRYPETFWSFRHALPFVGKKAAYPPLGLLTVASLLPKSWEKKLVDLNVRDLTPDDVSWADVVLISAMDVQESSARSLISSLKERGVKIVAGGPLFSSRWEEFPQVDHLVIGEGEGLVQRMARDLEEGRAEKIYRQERPVSLEESPVPDWSLVNLNDYSSLGVQFSRGCPYDCEFCDVTALFGRHVRTKRASQILAELDLIYDMGWRGGVFFVDDNLIGNRRAVKEELLPSLISWMEEKNYPFEFITQVSINVADDDELLSLLHRANFDELFIGIESPEEESLRSAGKTVNLNRDITRAVRKLQRRGFLVHGGFIVGFDTDTPSVFDRLIDFIDSAGIPVAMVGLLNAPRGTKLYARLKKEGRLLTEISGDNTDFSLNFLPVMDLETLISGYQRVVKTLYSPERFVRRTISCLKNLSPRFRKKTRLAWRDVRAFLLTTVSMGLSERWRRHYWKLLTWAAMKRPIFFPLSVKLLIYGYHLEKVFSSREAPVRT
ncbi:MAG: DUF4070 domain-containing protein [Deltaproteobacteria bacterium]|nr:MAG: DUF4070 domain-containing protein [Deltaproteobacteria bacterium]